jgi:hypothetical protein
LYVLLFVIPQGSAFALAVARSSFHPQNEQTSSPPTTTNSTATAESLHFAFAVLISSISENTSLPNST